MKDTGNRKLRSNSGWRQFTEPEQAEIREIPPSAAFCNLGPPIGHAEKIPHSRAGKPHRGAATPQAAPTSLGVKVYAANRRHCLFSSLKLRSRSRWRKPAIAGGGSGPPRVRSSIPRSMS